MEDCFSRTLQNIWVLYASWMYCTRGDELERKRSHVPLEEPNDEWHQSGVLFWEQVRDNRGIAYCIQRCCVVACPIKVYSLQKAVTNFVQ